MNKENTELLVGGLAVAALIGGGVILLDRDTCIKGNGIWKFPFGPCSCPSGTTWDATQKQCITTGGGGTPITSPSPPASVQVTNVQVTGADSWTASATCPASPNATSYKWFIDDVAMGTTTGPSATINGTGLAQNHSVGVAACN